MDIIKTIFVSALSSATTVVIVVFVFKVLLKRWVDYEFTKRQKLFDNREDLDHSIKEDILKKNVSIYPEIMEVVYRLRNIAREAAKSESIFGWDKPNFSEYCYHLIQSLYRYRLFLTEDTFKNLHTFKRLSQDLIILGDTSSRPENVERSENFDVTTKNTIVEISKELDRLYEDIVRNLKKPLRIEEKA
jgi:hypothetical protein